MHMGYVGSLLGLAFAFDFKLQGTRLIIRTFNFHGKYIGGFSMGGFGSGRWGYGQSKLEVDTTFVS